MGLAVVRTWKTGVPDGYVAGTPPLQLVNEIDVFPVQLTVPDEPKAIVLGDQVNFDVSATGIEGAGVVVSVTAALKLVIAGPASVYDVAGASTVASRRRPSAVVLPLSRP